MPARRRIDQVLDPQFLEGVEELDLDEIRSRRQLAGEVENELSYYRRLLHGRMDLIRFEQRRRSGEETRSVIEALPQILADPDSDRAHRPGRYEVPELPQLPDVGKRDIDFILGDDVLIRLGELDTEALDEALDSIEELEQDISDNRRKVQEVEDKLVEVLATRYRAG
jgi:hypothetical protein